jgi:flavin reductase (DIM6/NTAB) family NADH-FMN oxidoreductase RutF
MQINLSSFSPNQIYHLMTQTVVPRPIAWVLTDSANENYNLAPFSYFTAVSSAPPLLMFSVGKKPTGENKDTVENVKRTKQMVIHIASQDDASLVTQTAATLPHGESEVAINQIDLVPFEDFDLPRVASAKVAFGCSLYEIIEMGEAPQTLVFAKIETLFIDDTIHKEDEKGRLAIDASIIDPLARLGGGEYAGISSPFSLQRPK